MKNRNKQNKKKQKERFAGSCTPDSRFAFVWGLDCLGTWQTTAGNSRKSGAGNQRRQFF